MFKTHKVVDNVWIGVKYTSNKYKWTDDSDLIYTNWAEGSPKNKTDHCVQLSSDETSIGKWFDALCNKKNLVVCQKMQTWSLSHLQKLLLNTIKNPFPIGFIYVQLPKEKAPTEIWPWMTWNDVSSTYAGVFFRVTGEDAAQFGEVQGDNAPHISHVDFGGDCNNASWSVNIKEGIWSVMTGIFGGGTIKNCHKYSITGGEVRPRNMAIRVWKRAG